ncbi:MotA/TolQ/ExbB proton channel family protein [uncultured Salegentibacter sp.]|uniref:MotA/TolQ/ExbB proton channel family protein n=1 Tax=uncultured Salegentibacter sp. TaxID=259320 RepID=UPI002597DF56|nr:MotA/TolQ/ExbB proton channel family protein [uncultured Salegentibacter sp.]
MIPFYIVLAFLVWFGISGYLIFRVYKRENVNEHLYDSIPSVFTTIGVLGTFIGIYNGLQEFDTQNITESIPPLLEGLKTAFLTSIIGIILSILFGRLSEFMWGIAETGKEEKPRDEVTALNKILLELQKLGESSDNHFNSLKLALGTDDEKSISEYLVDLRNDTLDQTKSFENNTKSLQSQEKILENISRALGGKDESSLLSQLRKNRVENQDNFKTLFSNQENTSAQLESLKAINEKGFESTVKTIDKEISGLLEILKAQQQNLTKKFNEFSEILAKNNTEALVDVMRETTRQFNKQMSELINKLVQENFKELNTSVNKLNEWQHENKEMVSNLTEKYIKTTEQFKIASDSIETFTKKSDEIVTNTKSLTDENSQLAELITTLKKVLIEDERFQNSTNNLLNAITKVEENINAFDKTTHKLNDWIDKERGVKTRLDTLLVKLDEVADIKAYNGEFWEETRKQLNEGTNIITSNTKRLNDGINDINREFQTQLGEILGSLDELIQRIIAKYSIPA